ncbi:hypothetical protein [Psychrobacter sp. M13]|uniref:hypothetical protein n=1 Tax=Psychrobacter sp. M13 TaxID=3067275 RepID=UPI00273B4542|nr:hypothetical protein [Psychrobacter sp. M13]WLP94907.1 hypothetical protein Q9G97_01955 [Psychrobacter sp. M13]
MRKNRLNKVINLLEEKDIVFNTGLSDKEVEIAESTFSITFPPDLRLFLQTALPVSLGFVHWRYAINSEEGKKEVESRFNWPLKGMLSDVKFSTFWLDEWGQKPTSYEDQKKIVQAALADQPKLIPLYSHRYIPDEPNLEGNPIFSVYQTDIIHYGYDLLDYFIKEFRLELPRLYEEDIDPRKIKFWSKLIV